MGGAMGAEDNVKVVNGLYDALDAHDLESFVKLCAESVVYHTPDQPEPIRGREALREYNARWFEAMPDFRMRGIRIFGQSDWVCAEHEVTGTNTGPLPGPGGGTMPPTNRSVRAPGCDVLKVQGGKVTEIRSYFDLLGILSQLGLGPYRTEL